MSSSGDKELAMRVGTPHELGLLVRERRHDLRLSQAELADRAGVGRPWLVTVEKGHPRAELGKLLSLLGELGLTLDLSPDDDSVLEPGDQPDVIDLDTLLGDHDIRSRLRR